jgi:hypothetical protein
MWITLDPKQKVAGFGAGLFEQSQICNIENATKRHLMSIHRCTKSVYDEYQENASFHMQMGHQFEVYEFPIFKIILRFKVFFHPPLRSP